MTKAIAILISDCHYSLSTLELADTAFRAAIDKADELGVPLIDCGDLTNDKAIIRAEVANRLIKTMEYANSKNVLVYLLVGNHSLVNEKGSEHALNFLAPYASIVSSTVGIDSLNLFLIPYQNSQEGVTKALEDIPRHYPTIVMHQGVLGAFMGDYVQDKTSVSPDLFRDNKVFSGHYHRHQVVGSVTYIGNPYTLSFGEANDGPKGFLILNEDQTYERVILNLRKHIIEDGRWDYIHDGKTYNPQDLILYRVRGPKSELDKINKSTIAKSIIGHNNFRLDLIPDEDIKSEISTKEVYQDFQILDMMIDKSDKTIPKKAALKDLWRSINEAT